jgi:hypothetical protein
MIKKARRSYAGGGQAGAHMARAREAGSKMTFDNSDKVK